MQYLLSVTPSEMAATGAFNDRLRADGQWVFAGGLGFPDTATVNRKIEVRPFQGD